MGVVGLLRYMELYSPTACYSISIREQAENYKTKTGIDPVIVVDAQNCNRTIWCKGLDSVIGLEVQELFHRLREFVSSFEKIGVKLVFFIGGVNVEKKREEWLNRQRRNLQKSFGDFDLLKEGTLTKSFFEKCQHSKRSPSLPPAVGAFVPLFLKYALNCEVYVTIKECDEEIVEYVHKNECMAILTHDGDFIVSDTRQCKVLDSLKFDQARMTTFLYDREELARSLRIRTVQLPLFAILLGNYTIDQKILTNNFHRSICSVKSSRSGNISYDKLMPAVAKYINKLPDQPIDEILELICGRILGHEELLDSIKCSYHSYFYLHEETSVTANLPPMSKWSEILQVAEQRHKNFTMSSIIWGVLKNHVFETNIAFEDLRKVASGDGNQVNADSVDLIIPSSTITRLLRQRIYGILLFEYDHFDDVKVREWCGEHVDSYIEPVSVEPVKPIVPHPGLLQLWSSNENVQPEVKWKLFLSCISPNITTTDIEEWRELPDDLVVISATLFYLLEQRYMNEDETNAVIATVATHSKYSRVKLNEIVGCFHPRRTHISVVVTRTFSIIITLMGACGCPVPISENLINMKFEAKLFQIKYTEMKQNYTIEQLCENNDEHLDIFKQMKKVLQQAVDLNFGPRVDLA